MYTATLMPSGEKIVINEKKSLLENLKDNGHYIKSSCGGHATCTDCIVKIVTGEDNVNPPEFNELQLMGNVFHITKERLSCQTFVTGDITVDISAHDKAEDERRLKNKTAAFSNAKKNGPRVRKREEVEEILKERQDRYEQKQEDGQKWYKHWEKDSEQRSKRYGGGKRPREFRTDHIDHERDAKEREQKKLERERREKLAKVSPRSFNDSLKDKSNKENFSSRPAKKSKEEIAEMTSTERPLKSNPERKSFRKKKD
ncbi:2Fe-2S iron-sulfur cluster-binding protein [Halobacteriovorax marinus]|uniref:2Fe-2S iron-sulfur cluster-binding protein n=1 Tax=Halobacteriovorax marinus TaxID=97084 RepID=UPI003A8D0EB4